MNRRWLLHLYPRAWRERYSDEFLAHLESERLNAQAIADIVYAAAGARMAEIFPHTGPALRSVVGYYCAGHLCWFVLSSIRWLELSASSADAWKWPGLLASAAIQGRAAVTAALVAFGLAWVVLGPYPTRVRTWVLDWMRAIVIFVSIPMWLICEHAGIGPSREAAVALFGDPILLAVWAQMWTTEWAVALIRRWTDEPERWRPFPFDRQDAA